MQYPMGCNRGSSTVTVLSHFFFLCLFFDRFFVSCCHLACPKELAYMTYLERHLFASILALFCFLASCSWNHRFLIRISCSWWWESLFLCHHVGCLQERISSLSGGRPPMTSSTTHPMSLNTPASLGRTSRHLIHRLLGCLVGKECRAIHSENLQFGAAAHHSRPHSCWWAEQK